MDKPPRHLIGLLTILLNFGSERSKPIEDLRSEMAVWFPDEPAMRNATLFSNYLYEVAAKGWIVIYEHRSHVSILQAGIDVLEKKSARDSGMKKARALMTRFGDQIVSIVNFLRPLFPIITRVATWINIIAALGKLHGIFELILRIIHKH